MTRGSTNSHPPQPPEHKENQVQIEAGHYYLAQDGRSVVCAVAPAVEVMARNLPELVRHMRQVWGLPLMPPETAQLYQDDWAVVVIRGGHGDQRYKGSSTDPDGKGAIIIGPGAHSHMSEQIETEEDKEGLEKVMALYPMRKVSVWWGEADKPLADVGVGDFVRTANGSICVCAISVATEDDLKEQKGSVCRLGDFNGFVVCGGIGLKDNKPEGEVGTQIAVNVRGDLAGRYWKMAEESNSAAQADYIRAIKEDMRPGCIVRPVVVDPETT